MGELGRRESQSQTFRAIRLPFCFRINDGARYSAKDALVLHRSLPKRPVVPKRHRNGAPDRSLWLESSSNASFAIGSARSSAFLVTAISSPAFHVESVPDLPHRDCNPKHELPTQEHDIDTTLAQRRGV